MPPRARSELYRYPQPESPTDSQRAAAIRDAAGQLHDLFFTYREEQHVPGLAYGVVADGELVLAEAMGVREVETAAPVTLDTGFRIASMSKSFVALAILRLRDEGRLKLDDPVSKYLPELKRLTYPTTDSPPLTLRMLLTMSPGFPEDNPWGDRQMAIDDATFAAWMRGGIPFAHAPNTTFEYSNYAYAMLGRVVTRVSEMTFQQYVTRYVFKPLGMRSTVWDKKRVPTRNLAHGYRYEENLTKGGFEFLPQQMLPDGTFAAMAGIFTTIGDFARYMAFLMDAFPARDGRDRGPAKRSTVREMQQLARYEALVERKLPDGEIWRAVSGYGFGLAIWHDERLGYGVSHGGGLPGFGSYYYCLPHRRVGVVAFTYRTYSAVGMLFPRILDLLDRAGALKLMPVAPSERLSEVAAIVLRWLEGRADDELLGVLADNFLLDSDMEHRRVVRARARELAGATQGTPKFVPLNAMRGTWHFQCERGWLRAFVTLAPTMPPQLQLLNVTSGLYETV